MDEDEDGAGGDLLGEGRRWAVPGSSADDECAGVLWGLLAVVEAEGAVEEDEAEEEEAGFGGANGREEPISAADVDAGAATAMDIV